MLRESSTSDDVTGRDGNYAAVRTLHTARLPVATRQAAYTNTQRTDR